MEQEFLEALSSYYFGEKPSITDEEFELLKEELLWNGSKVCLLEAHCSSVTAVEQHVVIHTALLNGECSIKLKRQTQANTCSNRSRSCSTAV